MNQRAAYLKHRVLFWLLAVVILAGTVATSAALWALRSDAIEDALLDAHNIATVLTEQTVSSVQSIEIMLDEVQDRLAASRAASADDFYRVVSSEGMHEFLRDRLQRLRQAEVIAVIDRNGNIINSTRSWPALAVNLSDRDYFQYAKTHADRKLYVGTPVVSKVTGTMTLAFSTRITGPDDQFLGIVIVGIGIDYLQNIYRAISPWRDQSILLLRTDGTVILRYPDTTTYTYSGKRMPSESIWYRQIAMGSGSYRARGFFDGRERLVAVQPLKDYPLVINVGVSEQSVLQRWRTRALIIGIGAGIALVCLGILLKMLMAQFSSIMQSERSLAVRSRELEEANLKFDIAINNMSQGLCMFDANQRLVVCNELYATFYRLPPALLEPGTPHREIIAHRVRNGILKGDKGDAAVNAQLSALSALPAKARSVRVDEHANGRVVRIVREPMTGGGWVATHQDITEQRRAEQDLAETKQFLDSIIENIPVAIVVKDPQTRKLVLMNKAFEELLGAPEAELRGKTAFDLYQSGDAERMDELDRKSLEGGSVVRTEEFQAETPTRGMRTFDTRRIVIRDDGGRATHLLVVIDDITERKKSEQQIVFLAHHDALTGLANRAALVQKIDEAAARERRRAEPFSVLLLDLDRFKTVNDTFGHPAGDALLREVARRLKEILRETDVLARLGGDEFAIIQAGEAQQREAATTLADRIIETVLKPFAIEGGEVNIGTSIGIALAPEHAACADELLKMADLALYRAKSSGRNAYRFFDREMSEVASARHQIESDLRRALQNDELELYYQPIIDTKTGAICAAEALVRWRHPTNGLVAPDQFIPLAEETGLIAQIGEWVLHAACMEAAKWPPNIKVAVNLSPVQFGKMNLLDVVMCALAQSGLPAERLEVEITETALIESADECLPILRQFKLLGIAVALDDFGTAYSSLSRLTMFPFDKIKIDKSFTQNMTKRADCAAIISATLTLARSLDIATTAEGVETTDQYRILRQAGVTSVQGFLFKRPGIASEMEFERIYGDLPMVDAA